MFLIFVHFGGFEQISKNGTGNISVFIILFEKSIPVTFGSSQKKDWPSAALIGQAVIHRCGAPNIYTQSFKTAAVLIPMFTHSIVPSCGVPISAHP